MTSSEMSQLLSKLYKYILITIRNGSYYFPYSLSNIIRLRNSS